MRSLDEIFTYGYGQRRILFEEGLWCIYEKKGGINEILAIHRCERVRFALDAGGPWECGDTIIGGYSAEERGCGETAPDCIKTLIAIHRWKR